MQVIRQPKLKKTAKTILALLIFSTLLISHFISQATFADSSISYHVSVEEALNVTVKPSNVSIDLNPETKQFGIANLDVSVGTNYINGYKLYINSTSTNLTNTDYTNGTHGVSGAVFYIPTLDSGTTATASNFPTNHWGYRISSSDSSGDPNITSTTNFYPFSSNTLISSSYTATADNTTTLTFGAKADYDKPAGSYTNTFSFNATANPVTYSITYTDNTGDSTVTNLPTPNPASGMIAGTIIPVSSIVPERTGYTFKSWCMGTVSGDGTVCTGTEFTAGSNIDLEADKITDTTFTLTALWTANKYTIVYGTVANIAKVSLEGVECTTALSNGGCKRTLTYNETYSLVATPSTGYSLSSWSAGSYGSIASTTSASTTYTV